MFFLTTEVKPQNLLVQTCVTYAGGHVLRKAPLDDAVIERTSHGALAQTWMVSPTTHLACVVQPIHLGN